VTLSAASPLKAVFNGNSNVATGHLMAPLAEAYGPSIACPSMHGPVAFPAKPTHIKRAQVVVVMSFRLFCAAALTGLPGNLSGPDRISASLAGSQLERGPRF